jgi:hypothetical protein
VTLEAVEPGGERARPESADVGLSARPPDGASDLKTLIEGYERGLILAALGAVGGRQRSAAALLRILPTTLNEKMKRLGIRPRRAARKVVPPPASGVSASLRWTGAVAPGGTLELRGLNGPVRVEGCAGHDVEVIAVRRGPRALLPAVEVRIVEHAGGVLVYAVSEGCGPSATRRAERRVTRGAALVRVEIVARVPPGVRVTATTFNDDIEVVGLGNAVEATTANGRVRFLPRPVLVLESAPPERLEA